MRKFSCLTLLVVLFLLLVMVSSNSSSSVVAAMPDEPSGGVIEHVERADVGAQITEYLIIFEVVENSISPNELARNKVSYFLPELMGWQQEGKLGAFAPIQQLGAILLESPTNDVLKQVANWEGVQFIVPATELEAEGYRVQLERQSADTTNWQKQDTAGDAIAQEMNTYLLHQGLVEPAALDATFYVNNTEDVVDANPGDGSCETAVGNGVCTLRAAIQETNALPGADVINVASGWYYLGISGSLENAAATGDLDITDDLTLNGDPTAMTAVSGSGSYINDRVFHVITGTVTMNYLGVTGGLPDPNYSDFYGGGIYVGANTTLNLNYSTLQYNHSAVNGGAIYVNGNLNVFNSTISNNSSDLGGGIFINSGTVVINSSTVSDNSAVYYSGPGGGGILGNFTAHNSIIAGNVGNDCSGTLSSLGYNLVQELNGCTITGDTTGNITGLDANLADLDYNGGANWTHALLAGSPAIDAGDSSNCPATDQRGVVRPADGDNDDTAVCDIGAFESVYTVDITGLTVDVNGTYLSGYLSQPDVSMTLTLKRGAIVKSQINTVANGTAFSGYFSNLIEGGDTIEIEIPNVPTKIVDVPDLSLTIDKAANIVSGTGIPNEYAYISVYSYADSQWYYEYPFTNGDGQFIIDFSAQTDIFLGDELYLNVYDMNNYHFRTQRLRVHGVTVDPIANTVSGYAESNSEVNLTVKNSGGGVKGTTVRYADSTGWFWISLANIANIVTNDVVEVQFGGDPVQTIPVIAATVNSIDPSTEIVTGTGPANGKMEVHASDSYTTNYATILTNADGNGNYNANFTSQLDILRGSSAYVTYHNADDNEVVAGTLYAGPHIRAVINDWTDLYVIGQPNETIIATLRNGIGAIKATATTIAGSNGYASITFFDNTNSSVDIGAGDQIEVNFGHGVTQTLDAVGIDFVIDRDSRTITGSGPANQSLRLIYNYWTEADTVTDPSGNFSYTFSSQLVGGFALSVRSRNSEGNDVEVNGQVPVFTVNADNRSVNGYTSFNTAVVATLKNSGGTTEATASTTSSKDGFYWLNFSSDIVVGDTVIVDTSGLHYEQPIVPLSIAANTTNNIVYGTAPPNSWLNVYDQNDFGPYDGYNQTSFYADALGNFSANFGRVRGGDYLRVMYWEDGYKDQVELYRYAPHVQIDHTNNRVYGATTKGATGTVTLRNSSGEVKASAPVVGSVPYGNFSFLPGVDIVPGDQIETNIGVLNQIDAVIPMSGDLDLATNIASGHSLSAINLGVEANHWVGTYYSSWDARRFVTTSGTGAFSTDFSNSTDLVSGDYLKLYYYDGDTRYLSSFYTTSPTIMVNDYPTAVQPNTPIEVKFTLANGAHPDGTYMRWGTVSQGANNGYPYSSWQANGVIGENVQTFSAPAGGTVYFKVLAYVDGQAIWSDEHSIVVNTTNATTLYDPVSGTTNDNTPRISGIAAPNASITLYQDNVDIMTTTASANGDFTFQIIAPLAADTYNFHAVSTIGGVDGPDSNIVRLTIDPTLYVDPVRILLTTRGQTQHLRDASGYANLGGQIWTRTGDSVAISVPISYTNVSTADLYVGAVYETTLINSGADVYVGTYTPPSSGNYAVSIKIRGDGPTGPIYTVEILTGLIDPDGYVYDADLGLDYRIAGATVTCQMLTDEPNGTWTTWNASIWDQINPQSTVSDGYYAFFTLPGKYKVTVSAPGFYDYESPVLTVVDAPVHHNVPLVRVKRLYLPFVVRN